MHIRKLVSLLLALALLCAPFALAEESEEPKYGGTLVAYVSALSLIHIYLQAPRHSLRPHHGVYRDARRL